MGGGVLVCHALRGVPLAAPAMLPSSGCNSAPECGSTFSPADIRAAPVMCVAKMLGEAGVSLRNANGGGWGF